MFRPRARQGLHQSGVVKGPQTVNCKNAALDESERRAGRAAAELAHRLLRWEWITDSRRGLQKTRLPCILLQGVGASIFDFHSPPFFTPKLSFNNPVLAQNVSRGSEGSLGRFVLAPPCLIEL